MSFLIEVALCLKLVFYPAVVSFAAQGTSGSGTVYNDLPGTELNLFLSTVKVLSALVLTLILLFIAVLVLKKFMSVRKIPGFSGGAMTILEIRYIAPKRAVALITVLERVLIVGVSDQSLTTLGELTPEEIERLETVKKPEPGVFKNILSGFTGKKES